MRSNAIECNRMNRDGSMGNRDAGKKIINTFVCVSVCMCMAVSVYVCVCIYMCLCLNLYLFVVKCVFLYLRKRVCVFMYVSVHQKTKKKKKLNINYTMYIYNMFHIRILKTKNEYFIIRIIRIERLYALDIFFIWISHNVSPVKLKGNKKTMSTTVTTIHIACIYNCNSISIHFLIHRVTLLFRIPFPLDYKPNSFSIRQIEII